MSKSVVVPDLGNILEGEIIELNCKIGDQVNLGDILCSIEAEKAAFEIESSFSGTVEQMNIKIGSKVKSGDVLIKIKEIEVFVAKIDSAKDQKSEEKIKTQTISKTENNTVKMESVIQNISEFKEIEMKVPDFGSDKADVIELNFKVGDKVKKEDSLFTLESEKASVDIPSEYSGEIIKLFIDKGKTVNNGQLFAIIKVANTQLGLEDSQAIQNNITIQENKVEDELIKLVDIQYDVSSDENQAELKNLNAEDKYYYLNNLIHTNKDHKIYAGPSVRRLARELGIDLQNIKGSGKNQRILKEDLYQYTSELIKKSTNSSGLSQLHYELPDFSTFGKTRIEEFNKIQKITIKSMALSNQVVPQVTQFENADITDLEDFRQELKQSENKKITILPFIVKAMCKAMVKMPKFNASVDVQNGTNIYKEYFNIGIAVDTDYGLMVPVIKNIDQLNIFEIADEINRLAQKAKANKLAINEISGACISISSLGNIGGQHFTPIVNMPEVAILGISKSNWQYIIESRNAQPQNKLILPLSLSYDHRIINGADGVKFVSYLKYLLEDYRRISL